MSLRLSVVKQVWSRTARGRVEFARSLKIWCAQATGRADGQGGGGGVVGQAAMDSWTSIGLAALHSTAYFQGTFSRGNQN